MTEVLMTIIICFAFVSMVAITVFNNRTAPKPPDLYPEIEEDEGDDPDEEEIEAEIVPDEAPEIDNTTRAS